MYVLGTICISHYSSFVEVLSTFTGTPGCSDNANQGQAEGKIHPNVVCDGCDKAISGNRFKCMECPDYDLCGHCERNGLHADHNMMKITRPVGGPCFDMPRRGMFPGHCFPGPHHGRHHRPGEVGYSVMLILTFVL